MLSEYPKVSVSVCEQKEHVNSTGPQFKFHSSELTLNYDCTCSFKWRELLLGHQVHGLLPCAGKPGDGLLLLPLCRYWLFFQSGCQRQEKSNSCLDCRSHKEEVESLSSETECQKAPRIPEKEIWNLRQGKAEKSCGGRNSSCSCSTFSFKSPCNQVEEKGQHLELLPAGWRTPLHLLLDSQRKVKVRMHRLLPCHQRRHQLLLHPHLPLLNHDQLLDQDRLVPLTTTVSPMRTAIEGAYFLWYDAF